MDMAGTGVQYSPLATGINLAIQVGFIPDLAEREEFEVIREVGVPAPLPCRPGAEPPAGQSEFIDEQLPASPGPSEPARVAYVCSLISEGPLHDTLLYGRTTVDLNPRWIGFNELIDGALVSSDVHYSNQRTPTYFYQRNPIVEAVLERPELELAGVMLTLRYGSDSDKRRGARAVADLALPPACPAW